MLLPLPDSPTTETTSPRWTLNETSWSAWRLIGLEQAADRELLAEPLDLEEWGARLKLVFDGVRDRLGHGSS